MASLNGLTTRARATLVVGAALAGVAVGYVIEQAANPTAIALFREWSGPLWLSLRVAITSLALAGAAGVAVGYALAKGRFRGRDLLEALGSVPIILPPTVVGYVVLKEVGDTSLGRSLTATFGQPLNHFGGCVIAASIAAFPFCMRAARASIEGVDARYEQAARTMGLSNLRVAVQVTLPMARRGLGVGLTLGFLRALGEYGATLMIGGAIRGRTYTMAVAVGDSSTPYPEIKAMLDVLLALALLALALIAWLQRSAT